MATITLDDGREIRLSSLDKWLWAPNTKDEGGRMKDDPCG